MSRTSRLLDHWSPPDGAGAPVACLATTFTFEADFFVQDCLSRFLSLSMVSDEADDVSSLAALLEEEDRLAETQVTVLVDRSTRAEKRNLRWDLVPVRAPGGLLHAKVCVLIWERAARIILGSANLTSAGYRRQVELALAFDLDDNCRVPRSLLEGIVDELRQLVDLAPMNASGPRSRARSTIALLGDRIDQLDLPAAPPRGLRLAVGPGRPGMSPLDAMDQVWSGPQPIYATILSPFWDEGEGSRAVEAIRGCLKGRPAVNRSITAVVSRDPKTGVVRAPASLAEEDLVVVAVFDTPPGPDPRLLHAKLVILESNEWLAALIGSSNATEAGLGLNQFRGHHEFNIWIGCPGNSGLAKDIRDLAGVGEPITVVDEEWAPLPDEDEPVLPSLPLGFDTCLLQPGVAAQVRMSFDTAQLPCRWQVQTPSGTTVADAKAWEDAGGPGHLTVQLTEAALPSFLIVQWDDGGGAAQATWTVNVDDRALLPPPTELAALAEQDVDLLLRALSSTRPLPAALEHELRRRAGRNVTDRRTELDPLRRYDDGGLLLHRARQLSLALWRLQERLGRPTSTTDAVHWRLFGPVGPMALANGMVRAATTVNIPGEAQFFLAELALTVATVNWGEVGPDTAATQAIQEMVRQVLSRIESRLSELPPLGDAQLNQYVLETFAEARR